MKNYMEVIENVAKLMDKYGLCSVSYNENMASVHLAKNGAHSAAFYPVQSSGAVVQTAPESVPASHAEAASVVTSSGGKDVKSPMVGVFFAAPSPDSEPFVKIGDTVKKGDVLCILEAMKLMNEIPAEHDGKITNICAENGDVVEFGQVLFTIS
jgi:acetyl-CoA carboxylase biotin carboxyl carrier protein